MARKTEKVKQEDEMQEDASAHNKASIEMHPTDRVSAMTHAVNLIGTMSGEDINHFMDMVKQMTAGAASDAGADHGKNVAGIKMKPSHAKASMTETIKEAIAEIFGDDQDLSEEFKAKTATLFEAALSARMMLDRAELEAELSEAFDEQINEAVEALTENVNKYITYAAMEWLKENEVAIESTLTSELTEDVLAGIHQVFLEHNIDIPDDKVDVVEALTAKVEELELRLNEKVEENMQYAEAFAEAAREQMIDQVTEGLAMTQKEKFRTLVEGVEFDPETFGTKLDIIKEKYFTKGVKSTNMLTEEANELNEAGNDEAPVSHEMKGYMTAISKLTKRD